MRGLILAFETFNDLPPNWERFETIDTFGSCKLSPDEASEFAREHSTRLNIHRGLLDILDFQPPAELYDFCFIRHPDPWGEPKSWIRAIAALGACLNGNLSCIFHRQHEGLAFNFLLCSVLGQKNVNFAGVEQVRDITRGEMHLQLTWRIDRELPPRDMLTFYKDHMRPILRKFYAEIGLFHRDVKYFKNVDDTLTSTYYGPQAPSGTK